MISTIAFFENEIFNKRKHGRYEGFSVPKNISLRRLKRLAPGYKKRKYLQHSPINIPLKVSPHAFARLDNFLTD